jgi:hypothetical protein
VPHCNNTPPTAIATARKAEEATPHFVMRSRHIDCSGTSTSVKLVKLHGHSLWNKVNQKLKRIDKTMVVSDHVPPFSVLFYPFEGQRRIAVNHLPIDGSSSVRNKCKSIFSCRATSSSRSMEFPVLLASARTTLSRWSQYSVGRIVITNKPPRATYRRSVVSARWRRVPKDE